MKTLYIIPVLLFLHACSSQKSEISDINVLDVGSDTTGAFCSDFSLTNAQVLTFINKSRPVEADEFHNNYDYLPCYVKGTLNKEGSMCEYTLRAGGTVELSCDDKSGYLYVCDTCDDLLQ